MKKAEGEKAIRYLCHKWRADCGFTTIPEDELSFTQFYSWVEQSYGTYLQFRSTMGPREDVERWFDQEFHQMWRR